MAIGGLSEPPIDWSAAWLEPLRGLRSYLARADWREALSALSGERGVRTATGLPIEFATAEDAGASPYEAHIAATGRVPTRDNRHDLFNALIWLTFPLTKAALNARQAADLARDGVRERRGPVRDAATLIDESGLLLAADDRTLSALQRLDWAELLIVQRARWGREIVPLAFGHALIEKLVTPYRGITAAVVCLRRPEDASLASIDAAAARWVNDTALTPKLLAHLPVLGIPGWWPPNDEASFYADSAVFRARRAA